MSSHVSVECLDCGHLAPYSPTAVTCPSCGGQWREARYELDKLKGVFTDLIKNRPFDMWRYKELLPVNGPNPALSIGEGGTPLFPAANLGMMLGCPNIYIKDERQGPTASFKDRQAAVTITSLKEAGITEAVLASTGNVAISFSAFAARAGIRVWTFLTSLVPAEKMREVALYGSQVVKVTASYDQAKQLAAEFARQRGLYLERGSRSIPSVEAMKTIAFEIAEQLTEILGPPAQNPAKPNGNIWRAPDWYIQAVSGGLGPHGVQKGFIELQQMGLIDKIPAFASIQTDGCAPMVHAWKQGLEVAEPIRSPRTHITTLSTGDPGRTYTLLRERMLQSGGGVFESVTDEEAYRTIHVIAKMEGLSIEPATAVAFAGLIKMVRMGVIKPTDLVVVNCSGHTMPIEKMILGEGWSRDLEISPQALRDTPEEGLFSALSRVTTERFSRVAVVDDTPDARRLICRILQSQGAFKLYEASNGKEAIELAKKELPDLIILDLMMPELDGFSVLDALKEDPQTSSIPVIVVTAKELTNDEKARLQGRIHTLMQKGEFMNDDLLDEVTALLK
ncbi:MAG: pyridoxal-phosphate dependent enzyme [Anaerolineales bacterium]|nr:pyridoxal-phosphate dependent enzyme [Anaerolineales bacterium]